MKIVDVKGKEVDQGELLRWLGEAPLFPTTLDSAKVILLIKTLLLTASASSILMKKDKSLNLI